MMKVRICFISRKRSCQGYSHFYHHQQISEEKNKIFQAQKKFPVGSIVDVAPFGLGFISEYITSETEGTTQCIPCAKILVEWFLADGKPATMYVPLCKLTKPFYGRNIETGSFGTGKLWKMRNEDHDVHSVEMEAGKW